MSSASETMRGSDVTVPTAGPVGAAGFPPRTFRSGAFAAAFPLGATLRAERRRDLGGSGLRGAVFRLPPDGEGEAGDFFRGLAAFEEARDFAPPAGFAAVTFLGEGDAFDFGVAAFPEAAFGEEDAFDFGAAAFPEAAFEEARDFAPPAGFAAAAFLGEGDAFDFGVAAFPEVAFEEARDFAPPAGFAAVAFLGEGDAFDFVVAAFPEAAFEEARDFAPPAGFAAVAFLDEGDAFDFVAAAFPEAAFGTVRDFVAAALGVAGFDGVREVGAAADFDPPRGSAGFPADRGFAGVPGCDFGAGFLATTRPADRPPGGLLPLRKPSCFDRASTWFCVTPPPILRAISEASRPAAQNFFSCSIRVRDQSAERLSPRRWILPITAFRVMGPPPRRETISDAVKPSLYSASSCATRSAVQ